MEHFSRKSLVASHGFPKNVSNVSKSCACTMRAHQTERRHIVGLGGKSSNQNRPPQHEALLQGRGYHEMPDAVYRHPEPTTPPPCTRYVFNRTFNKVEKGTYCYCTPPPLLRGCDFAARLKMLPTRYQVVPRELPGVDGRFFYPDIL